MCSTGREKIPGTTMVLIHQGAVRVEPEPVTAIQEEGQRLTAGHCPPLASGTTQTRPLTDRAPRHQATGGASAPAQTPDAPHTPPHPENPSDWPLCQALDTPATRHGRFTCSTLVSSSGDIPPEYHVHVESTLPSLIRLQSTRHTGHSETAFPLHKKSNSLIIYSLSAMYMTDFLTLITQTNTFRKIINLCESIKASASAKQK